MSSFLLNKLIKVRSSFGSPPSPWIDDIFYERPQRLNTFSLSNLSLVFFNDSALSLQWLSFAQHFPRTGTAIESFWKFPENWTLYIVYRTISTVMDTGLLFGDILVDWQSASSSWTMIHHLDLTEQISENWVTSNHATLVHNIMVGTW